MTTSGPDRPIFDREEDLLGRWHLAKAIFDLIDLTPKETTLRIGVYGGWGEGKTSVMELVASQATERAIPVCRFPVWSAGNQAELWAGFVDALEAALPPDQRDRKVRVKKAAKAAQERLKAAEGLPYASVVDALVGLAGTRAQVNEDDTKRVLGRLATSGRVVVMVDDLDRVDPSLLPRLLMGLHQMFEGIGRCAFVIAVDPAVVSRGLATLNPGWDTSSSFLDKIVQYQYWLIPPPAESRLRLIERCIEEYGLDRLAGALTDHQELLHTNPRELKQFLRSLARLNTSLSRYGREEWHPGLLTLIELFRHEGCEAAQRLFADEEFLKEFGAISVHDYIANREASEGAEDQIRRRIELAVTGLGGASSHQIQQLTDRLRAIAKAASRLTDFLTVDDVKKHIHIEDAPPLLTMKEFEGILSAWSASPSYATAMGAIGSHAERLRVSEGGAVAAFLRALISRRDVEIDAMYQAFEESSAAEAKVRFGQLSSLLSQLLVEGRCFGRNDLSDRRGLFRLLRQQHIKALNQLGAAEYASALTIDRDLILSATGDLADIAVTVMEELKPWTISEAPAEIAGAARINQFNAELVDRIGQLCVDAVLSRFSRQDGIRSLTPDLGRQAEMWMLHSPDSPLHASGPREALKELAGQSGSVVAMNFFAYLSAIAGEPGSGFSSGPLLNDRDLITTAWRCARHVRPQPHMRARVTQLAERLRAGLGDRNAIDDPPWPADVSSAIENRTGGGITGTGDGQPH